MVHAHTQAQIAAGIYKGDAAATAKAKAIPATTTAASTSTVQAKAAAVAGNAPAATSSFTPAQMNQQTQLANEHVALQKELAGRHSAECANLQRQFQTETDGPTKASQPARMKELTDHQAKEMATLKRKIGAEMIDLQASFRKPAVSAPQYTAPVAKPAPVVQHAPPASLSRPHMSNPPAPAQPNYAAALNPLTGEYATEGGQVFDPEGPQFLGPLNDALTEFWAGQLQEMRALGEDQVQNEQDFKNHNDLPLARIKRIMKSDEDVRMISAEAPVLFAKACEMFILEMSLRSFHYSENNKRKTLQKEDVIEAIQRTDIFDFLVDVISP